MPKVIRCSSELDEEYTEGPTRALVQVFDCDTNIASHISHRPTSRLTPERGRGRPQVLVLFPNHRL